MQPFFAYLLRCSDGSYYAGHTDDLERRVAQHAAGEVEGYTSSRRPVELVWSEEFDTREEALEIELKLKRWTRAEKEALMRGDWLAIKELARGPDRSERRGRAGESGSSPFDSGPAGGRPYAQGERGRENSAGSVMDPRAAPGPVRVASGPLPPPVPAVRVDPAPGIAGSPLVSPASSTCPASARPEPFDSGPTGLRSGQAESKGELMRR